MSKKITITTPPTEKYNKEQGWHTNTDMGCDVKTILRSDRKMKVGKGYPGVFRLDGEGFVEEFLSRDAHYTFTETLPWTMKRNPRVFVGKYISITRRSDGSLRPNFRPVKMDDGFSVDHYADGVRYELLLALGGLVGEK